MLCRRRSSVNKEELFSQQTGVHKQRRRSFLDVCRRLRRPQQQQGRQQVGVRDVSARRREQARASTAPHWTTVLLWQRESQWRMGKKASMMSSIWIDLEDSEQDDGAIIRRKKKRRRRRKSSGADGLVSTQDAVSKCY